MRKGQTEWPLVLAVGAELRRRDLVLQPAVETNQWLGGAIGCCRR
jgi:hypothetical protein